MRRGRKTNLDFAGNLPPVLIAAEDSRTNGVHAASCAVAMLQTPGQGVLGLSTGTSCAFENNSHVLLPVEGDSNTSIPSWTRPRAPSVGGGQRRVKRGVTGRSNTTCSRPVLAFSEGQGFVIMKPLPSSAHPVTRA